MTDVEAPLIYLVAGESSGDALGARLIVAIANATDGRARFRGVGGPMMRDAGLESLFPMADLAVMGVAEVAGRLPLLLRRIRETVADVEASRPDVLVTIDSPDFSFRVAKRLDGTGVPRVHFVAPSVWAWRPGRAAKVARFLDHLLCLLPFEPPYFEREGLAATFVGHPVLESGADKGAGAGFRTHHGLAAGTKLLAVLPGSRMSEVSRLVGVFGETVRELQRRHSGLAVALPTVPHVADAVRAAVADWPVPTIVIEAGAAERYDAFAAADAAVAASGTVALELAMAGTPAVIAYRLNPLTAWLARRLVKVRFVSLVNILLDRAAVPELLLGDCRAETLVPALDALLAGGEQVAAQRAAYAEALALLGEGGVPPSERAAAVVLDIAARGRR